MGLIAMPNSNSLIASSVKNSVLLNSRAFGETRVKERIKNVLNYKKPAFWVSLIAVAVVIVTISVSILTAKDNTAGAALHENGVIGDNMSWGYGEFDDFLGFSNLLIFPELLAPSAIIEDYYYECSNDAFFDPTCQVYLECSYDETDFYEEIKRIAQIQVTYDGKVNKIRFREDRFNFPAYITVDGNNYCYEYVLLLLDSSKFLNEECIQLITI
jgi:hypothetical protein